MNQRTGVQILIPLLTFCITLGNFLDLLEEETGLLAHGVIGTMTGDNESSSLNKSSIQYRFYLGVVMNISSLYKVGG